MQDSSSIQLCYTTLAPDPRWGWRKYPVRWLVGGCWSLWQLPLRGTLYGTVFFLVACSWSRALAEFTAPGFALAASLTGVTLLMAPRLTAGLLDGMAAPAPAQGATAQEMEERRQGALIGLGALLVMILSIAFNAAVVCFALFFDGDVPPLERLSSTVFSWENAPLVLLLVIVSIVAGLGMQAAAMLPTYVLRELEVDLFGAVRSSTRLAWANWRPLLWWGLGSQALLLAGAVVWPVSLVLLTPMIACGTWWACREMTGRRGAEGLRC